MDTFLVPEMQTYKFLLNQSSHFGMYFIKNFVVAVAGRKKVV